MRSTISVVAMLVLFISCNSGIKVEETKTSKRSIEGTWKLLTGTLVEKGETIVTDYTKGKEFIKIINNPHFSFLSHDLNKGKDSTAEYSSGGGHYALSDNAYTENLEYCSDRQWEGNSFNFTVMINNDTLTQQGIEKIDSLGINRINTERYVRVKD